MPRYLLKQRQGWYAVLEIPKSVRKTFGKSRFKQTLQTDSISVARQRVLPFIAEWKRLIQLARNGGGTVSVEAELFRLKKQELFKQGVPERDIDEALFDIAVNLHRDPDMAVQALSVANEEWLLLSDHIGAYLASASSMDKPKTVDMKRGVLVKFTQRFTYAHDVTKRGMIDWVENELMGKEGLSVATCERMVSSIRGYWSFLERHKGLEVAGPFKDVIPSQKKAKSVGAGSKTKRKSFSPRDYHKLMASIGEDAQLGELIRLAAYTGCRIEELCSLKIEKVTHDRFEIEDAKTEAGWRTIPIHPAISDLVLELRRDRIEGYLIEGLTFNKYGDRSNAIGKRFGRLKKRCGYGADMVFHSFRKGVASQLENNGVPENITARLLGHEFYTMSYGVYSGGVSFEVLRKALGKLAWS